LKKLVAERDLEVRSDEGDPGKKVVSPRAKRTMARYATDRGLSQRRAAWLCSTPRSGIHYRSKCECRDRHLSAALRVVARSDPAWGYRLALGHSESIDPPKARICHYSIVTCITYSVGILLRRSLFRAESDTDQRKIFAKSKNIIT
jgi:hypothetical protein